MGYYLLIAINKLLDLCSLSLYFSVKYCLSNLDFGSILTITKTNLKSFTYSL